MASNVQFIGTDQVIRAFEARNIDIWSIWCGKEYHIKGNGVEELKAYLDMIAESQTAATYTLKVYEDLTDIKEVKSNTPHDGSFNFKLFSVYDQPGRTGIIGRHYGYPSRDDIVLQKLQEFDTKLNLLAAGPEIDPEEETIEKAVLGMIQEPSKLHEFFQALQQGKNLLMGHPVEMGSIGSVFKAGQTKPGSSAAAGQAPQNLSQQSSEEIGQRIATALDILEQNDPQLVEHLEKLAIMAQNNPVQFKTIIGFL